MNMLPNLSIICIIPHLFSCVKGKHQYIVGLTSQNTNISLVVFLSIVLYNIIIATSMGTWVHGGIKNERYFV